MAAVALGLHVSHAVLGDADQPCGGRALVGSKRVAAVPRRHEDLLGDIFGVVTVAEGAISDRVHEGRPPPVHLGEGVT